ncbi:MAG: hypothetical protein U0796_04650 [Gemmatales bacterium]
MCARNGRLVGLTLGAVLGLSAILVASMPASSSEGKYAILFQFLSDDYRHNGRAVSFPKDGDACSIFFVSDNPRVVALAEDLQDLIYLRVKLKGATAYWRKAAMDPQELRKNIIDRMIDEIPRARTRENRRNFADDIMTDLQLSVPSNTRAVAAIQLLSQVQKMLQGSIPPLLEERYPGVAENADALSMKVVLEPGKLPAEMTLVNKSGMTLENALVWYSLDVDPPPGISKEELESLRFARDMGFRKAVQTRFRDRELQDFATSLGSHNIIYIPVLKPNDTVKIPYDLGAVRRCHRAKFSLVSDQLKTTEQDIEGLKEMQQKIETMVAPRAGTSAPGKSGTPSKAGSKIANKGTTSAKPPSDGLAVNSVWRGTLKAGSGPAQQLELTIMQRDGNQFKGRVSFNRRGASGAQGTIEGQNVSWNLVIRGETTDLKYTGTVKGRQLTGTFTGPGSNNQPVEGTFSLSLETGPCK